MKCLITGVLFPSISHFISSLSLMQAAPLSSISTETISVSAVGLTSWFCSFVSSFMWIEPIVTSFDGVESFASIFKIQVKLYRRHNFNEI